GRFVADGERLHEPAKRAFASRTIPNVSETEHFASLHRVADLFFEHEAHGGIDGILLPPPAGAEGHRREADLLGVDRLDEAIARGEDGDHAVRLGKPRQVAALRANHALEALHARAGGDGRLDARATLLHAAGHA